MSIRMRAMESPFNAVNVEQGKTHSVPQSSALLKFVKRAYDFESLDLIDLCAGAPGIR